MFKLDIEKLFQNDAFKVLEPEKLIAYKELSAKLAGKSQIEVMGIILDFQKNMSKNNGSQSKKLTREENAAMVYCIMEAMPEEDRKKYTDILKILSSAGQI